ncbi:bifunctional lytic transglycosylase/C40 family peptidase [Streptomyces sp. NPDC048442]|uniref:C40 family peptidase n=1 Tax=Streptomyces sp. NPDC048442 TaxID=3154823 RepID=UPI003420341F
MKLKGKLGCLTVVLLLGAVCCAVPLSSAVNALAALSSQQDTVTDDGAGGGEGSSADIPARMLAAYKNAVRLIGREAAACRGMRWPILAGIARIESHHAQGKTVTAGGDISPHILGPLLNGSGVGDNTTEFGDTDGGRWDGTASGERAVGPFQFLPATWNGSGRDGNGDGQRNPHNGDDAALGAAVYLCGKGRNLGERDQLRKALYQYNNSQTYVNDVLGWIDTYTSAASSSTASGSATGRAKKVIDAALAMRDTPYSWGGGNAKGPSTGTCCSPSGKSGVTIRGFDCSGLTTYAFAQARITLPRSAAAQAGRGKRIPASAGTQALRPGDLVFYGYIPTQDSTIHHVGIYLGGGRMVNAARPGTVVRIDALSSMPDYAGGARLL